MFELCDRAVFVLNTCLTWWCVEKFSQKCWCLRAGKSYLWYLYLQALFCGSDLFDDL